MPDLVGGALLYQRVKEHDAHVPQYAEPKEVRIRVCAASAAVDNVQFGEGKLQ